MKSASNATDRLLQRVAYQVERARHSTNPVERARIAASLQWYGGWTLRFAVEECREAGMTWPVIGERLDARQTTVFDQYRAGGPIVLARPHRNPGGHNDIWAMIWKPGGQTPLRQTATKLVDAVLSLDTVCHDTETARCLYRPVQEMARAQTAIDNPHPLIRTTKHVLAVAADLAAEHGYPQAAASDHERSVWDVLADLATVYERDQELIRVAADVAEIMQDGETE